MVENNVDLLKGDITSNDLYFGNAILDSQNITKRKTIVKYLSFNAPNGSRTISDSNALVAYSEGWDVSLFTRIGNPKHSRTVHTTGVNGSYANLTFFGSKIYVIGFVPPGQSPLFVDYVIDGGEPQSKPMVASKVDETLGNQVLFESDTLAMQDHKLGILFKGTGEDRNYTLDYFQVVGSEKVSLQMSSHNTSLLIGVAWVTSLLLIMSIGAFTLWWCRRRSMGRGDRAGHFGDLLKPPKSSVYLVEEQEGSFDPYLYSGSYMPVFPSSAYAKGTRHTIHMTSGAWRSFANPLTPDSDLQVERHNSLFTTRTSVTIVAHQNLFPNIRK